MTQIFLAPEYERRAKYKSENPEEAKILEEYEEKKCLKLKQVKK